MRNLGKSPRRLKEAILDENWSAKRRPQTTLQFEYNYESSKSKYAFGTKVSTQQSEPKLKPKQRK